MARFPTIICATVIVVASVVASGAQATRPAMPGRQPSPLKPPVNVQQQPTGAPQQTVQQPSQQNASQQSATQATGQPSQQPGVQPGNRPAETPANGPAVAPVVSYRDGLLSVQALNSNLSSVIAAIRSKTGIEFEGAEGVGDRVALSLGPAPAADVLSSIFSGSKFDFVAIGRPDSPGIVQRVILTRKTVPGAVAGAQPEQRPNNNGEGDEEDVPDEQVNAGDPQDTPVQPVPVPQTQPQTQNQQPDQPKSSEQLLQELQQLKQQQKQPPDPQNPPQAPLKRPPQ